VGFVVCFYTIIMINFHSDNLARPEKIKKYLDKPRDKN